MGADWTSIENALQAWVKAATGFNNAHAYWANPNVHRPPEDGNPFAILEITDRTPVGLRPETAQIDHSTNPQGQEIELQARQVMDCGIRVQIYAPPLRGTRPGTPRGAANAASLAEAIRLAAALPSVMDSLDAVGVSVHDMGQVHYVPEVVGTDFEGRAVLDAKFYVSDFVSEFTGYIASVQLADQEASTTQTINIPDDPNDT
jgi:hypothetical protein